MTRYPIPGKAHAIQADITLTVGGLGAVVQHKAGKLTALGLIADDQIVILGWKSPDWIVNLWAVRAAGIVDDSLLQHADLAQRLTEQLKPRLASFAIPSRWQFQSKPLPLTDAGKLDRIAFAQTGTLASSLS